MRIFAAIAVFVFGGAYCFESHNARRWERKATEALTLAERAQKQTEEATTATSNAILAAETWKNTAILWKEIATQAGVDVKTTNIPTKPII